MLVLNSVFDGFMCQTIRAHRISRKAYEVGGQEVQEKYLDMIFHAYFTEGKNISDHDVLGELAEQAGVMSKEEVRLSNDNFRNQTDDALLPCRRLNTSSLQSTGLRSSRWRWTRARRV